MPLLSIGIRMFESHLKGFLRVLIEMCKVKEKPGLVLTMWEEHVCH